MTPTALATALRNVEIANEETNYTKFQSDAAIVEEAAEVLEEMTPMLAMLQGKIEHLNGLIERYEKHYVPRSLY